MKIAFLTSEYPHPKTGHAAGIGTSIMNLCHGLRDLGHEVSVFVYGQGQDDKFTDGGILFYRIRNVKVKGFSRILTQKKIQRLLNKLVDDGAIDIVEAPDWTGITSRINLKCPLVIKLHGSDTYFCHLDNRPVKWINKWREKKALLKADALVSVSQYTANITQKLFYLNSTFTIIPNCIDLNLFFITDDKTLNHENTILYFGTLIRKKGLLELPLIFNEIYKKNHLAKLVLIGHDASDTITGNVSTWGMMQSLFEHDAFKNVTYLGSIPYYKIRENICMATVCVFPTFAEALPVSWIEAMSMRKAIVASDIGWAEELISDEIDGFLVNPQKHVEFSNKVLALLENKEMRDQFGVEARNKVEKKFSVDVVAKQSIAFYQKTLEGRLIKKHDYILS